jgi:hypothetical protein
MHDKLEIINLSKSNNNKEWNIKEPLMKPIFRLLIVGSSASGKTNLIKNILTRTRYKDIFKKNIWLFSPTVDLSDSYDFIKKLEDEEKPRIFKDFNAEIIESIKEEQEIIKNNMEELKLKHAPQLLFIFDDMISKLPQSKLNIFEELFISGRHWNINIIVVSQSYYHINLLIRRNCTHFLFMEGMSKRDIMKLSNEELPYIDDLDFFNEYKKLKRYEFIYIDIFDKKYYKNFTKLLN